MSTKQVGDESEAVVLAELIGRDYSISIPFGDNDPYDLIVDADPELHRVQVKTGWLEDGQVRVKTCSRTTKEGDPAARDYTAAEIDTFAVRCRELGALYWVPVEVAGTKNSYLRVESPDIDHPRINRATEFRFDENPP